MMVFNSELYHLAASARQKLSYQASQTDHDLRSLVLHANLLDALLLEMNTDNAMREQTDEETQAALAQYHARLHGSTEPVVCVTERNQDAEDDEDHEEEELDSHTFQSLRSSPTGPPPLTHDTDSDSDYSYGSDSDYGYDTDSEDEESNEFEVDTNPESPTTSISEDDSPKFAADLKDDGLALRRVPSRWKAPSLAVAQAKPWQRRGRPLGSRPSG